MKKSKTNKASKIVIWSLVFVSVALAISLFFNFYGETKSKRVSTFTTILGEDVEIKATNYGAFSTTVMFSGEILENTTYSQKIIFSSSSVLENCVIRAKAKIDIFDTSIIMGGYTNWLPSVDGYVYFNSVLKAGEKIGVCNFIDFPEDLMLNKDKNYGLTFTIEVLPNNQTVVEDIWGNYVIASGDVV